MHASSQQSLRQRPPEGARGGAACVAHVVAQDLDPGPSTAFFDQKRAVARVTTVILICHRTVRTSAIVAARPKSDDE